MWPIFTNPWALLGFLSIPALVAIYWLRHRHRRRPVSSLMLWVDVRELKTGGPRFERFQAPLLFFLELLLLILLVLAACGIHWPTTTRVRPIVVVLDDSFSMQAGGDESARARAVQALKEMHQQREGAELRFVLAGAEPRLLNVKAKTWAEVESALADWKCRAATASLKSAVAFASGLVGDLGLVLVLSDQSPPGELVKGRVQWWAFGKPRDNLAITRAFRTPFSKGSRCLLEVTNHSSTPQDTALVLNAGFSKRIPLQLKPRETRQLPTFTLPEGTAALQARLDSQDELALDDQVTLLVREVRPVRAAIQVGDAKLRRAIAEVVRARGRVALNADQPELVFTDQGKRPDVPDGVWVVHVLSKGEPIGYEGPFNFNHKHPLADGLALRQVVWAAGKEEKIPGDPVVWTAGDVRLVTENERADGSRSIYLRVHHEYSHLGNNWVILMVNLLDWRERERPGLSKVNVSLDHFVELRPAVSVEQIEVVAPDGESRSMPVTHGRAVLHGEQVGTYELRYADKAERFAVNALNPEESSLEKATSGRWGDWLDATTLRLEYRGVTWILVLVALAIVALHFYLAQRTTTGAGQERESA